MPVQFIGQHNYAHSIVEQAWESVARDNLFTVGEPKPVDLTTISTDPPIVRLAQRDQYTLEYQRWLNDDDDRIYCSNVSGIAQGVLLETLLPRINDPSHYYECVTYHDGAMNASVHLYFRGGGLSHLDQADGLHPNLEKLGITDSNVEPYGETPSSEALRKLLDGQSATPATVIDLLIPRLLERIDTN
ncbi:hypothetical protein J4464_07670 [Candidatus Woesearchaeota archaeon]|nr:hypothetical protein [Candidatus Woesearchaeota archaeon]